MNFGWKALTLAAHAVSVDTGAADHDVVNNRKAALAANVVPLAVSDASVGQDGSLVKLHASTVLCFGEWNLSWVEPLPARPVDDLIGRVAQDVDDRVRRIENAGIFGEVCQDEP